MHKILRLAGCAVAILILSAPGWGSERQSTPASYFAVPENREAWRLLPRADKGQGEPLPAWARVMARSLPSTTAAMLELDYLHRARGPLDAQLRGKMRWAAAHANRCAYSEACALDDLRRAGVSEKDIRMMQQHPEKLPEKERKAMVFAHKMMTAAYKVSDEEMSDLLSLYGEKPVVAMVLMLAHASFQDRIILSLGLGEDRVSPLAPVAVAFSQSKEASAHVKVPDRKSPEAPVTVEERQPDLDWLALDQGQLHKCMARQRERKSRIRIPSPEELSKIDVKGTDRSRVSKVLWNAVTSGYQPELADGWKKVTRSFRAESKQDRLFGNSVFWVVTRSLECFY